jgi:hypothetical protein
VSPLPKCDIVGVSQDYERPGSLVLVGTIIEVEVGCTCIDQNNIEERNHQVAEMGRIYTEARQVAVWLGESDENNSIIFGFFWRHAPVEKTLGFFSRSFQSPTSLLHFLLSRLLE